MVADRRKVFSRIGSVWKCREGCYPHARICIGAGKRLGRVSVLVTRRILTSREIEEGFGLDGFGDESPRERERWLGCPVSMRVESRYKLGTRGEQLDIAEWGSGVRLVPRIVNTSLSR